MMGDFVKKLLPQAGDLGDEGDGQGRDDVANQSINGGEVPQHDE